MRRNFIIGSLALLALLTAGCGSSTNSASSASASASASGTSTLACGHWENIRGDIYAEILTDSELRTKVSEVRDSATSSDVESAATELLAGITGRNNAKVVSGFSSLNRACS